MPVLMFLKSVGEAVASRGLKGLMGLVPFGEQVYDIGKATIEAYQRRSREAKIVADAEEMLQATMEEIKEEAKRISTEIGAEQNLAPEEVQQLESYLTQVPAVAKQSLKRPKDPSGTTIPVSLDLNNPVHVASLLPKRTPQFKAGQAVPNSPSYVFSEILGAGGFGEVWLARHTFLDQARAFKFCLDETARDRLLRHEGEVVKRVMAVSRTVRDDEHGIVPLVDAYLGGDTPWLAYEYVDGGDLSSLVRELSTQTPQARSKVSISLVINLAKIVGKFHNLPQAIIHRDLKPANILMRKAGKGWVLRVTDFGISHVAAQQGLQKATVSTPSMNLGDTFRGAHTPIYASPQQKKGEKPDVRDDVHALGMIGYQMLLGDLSAERPSGKWQKKFVLHDLPQGVLDLLGSCFDDDPDERPKDANELAEKLVEFTNKTIPLNHVRIDSGTSLVEIEFSNQPPSTNTIKLSFPDIVEDFQSYQQHVSMIGKSTASWLEKYVHRKDRWAEAAAKGFDPAMVLLGDCFEEGVGFPQDFTKAMEWYRKAADMGNFVAMTTIGTLYRNGKGVPQDYSTALDYYLNAANLGYAAAMCNVGSFYSFGFGVSQNYSEAIKWYRKSANLGHSTAMSNLGNIYRNGKGVTQDYGEAMSWYLQAAELGHVGSMYQIGLLYMNGDGVIQDHDEAIKWYRKAANADNPLAMYELGLLYRDGECVVQDDVEAMSWFLKAANFEHPPAVSQVGNFYFHGYGIPQDYAEAIKWYLKAADLGQANAMNNLGFIYEKGKGVPKDTKKAKEWYQKAADLGHQKATEKLKTL